jgi:hypothetical protein
MAPRRERAIEQPGDIAGVAVEPALRLDEIEEQDARQRGQGEGVAVGPHARG